MSGLRAAVAATTLSLILTTGTATSPAQADPARDRLLAGYAATAKAADAGFAGFSADRGRSLFFGPHAGGKPDTPACATCHTRDPAAPGQHVRTGRAIEPMAVRANPARFTDAAAVAKRFDRDCPGVLGRDCTAQEKGDLITYLTTY